MLLRYGEYRGFVESSLVDCGAHGKNKTAFVGHHLLTKINIGWHENNRDVIDEEDEFGDCISTRCDECEDYRLEHNGWDEESEKFANITLVCESCALKFKSSNLK